MAGNGINPEDLDREMYRVLLKYLRPADHGVTPGRERSPAGRTRPPAELERTSGENVQPKPLTSPGRGEATGALTEREDPSRSGPAAGAAEVDALPFAYPQLPGQRYRLDGEVDRGGMGTIFKGHDTRLDRQIAFKFLLFKHHEDADQRRRFVREARITGRLQHPGIVPVYDAGQSPEGHLFFTMSLVQGQCLARFLDERPDPALELPRFLKVFEKVCEAVAYAHSEGVIHRDLKPANVMVAPFGVVHVMDWGCAKCLRDGAGEPDDLVPEAWQGTPADCQADTPAVVCPSSREGHVLGTPAYMAPEQARGELSRIDERADVFGLGGILCMILTGRPPYLGGTTAEICDRAKHADLNCALARLDSCAAERDVVGLAKRCLAARPEDRPRDGGAVAAAVTAYLESDLRRAERDLVRFFDLSPDLFCVAGLDGFFYRVNGNFSRILGYTDAELLARPFLDFVHPGDRDRTLGAMEKLARGIPVIRFRNRYRDARGAYRWFEWTGKSIPEEGVIFAVARDVTDWIELERNLSPERDSGESAR
jgi:serine/threonine-protein kinase